jgi:hypothetical protein
MASLSDKRIARLHQRVLRAADQFSFVRCGAIQRLDRGHGVSDEEWCGLLQAAPHSAANDVARLRVLIDGKEWTAGWYFSYSDSDVSHAEFREATKEIERLSKAAASQFGLPTMGAQCWLHPAMTDPLEARWLAVVLGMRFVKEVSIPCTRQHPAFVVRELDDDFFTASARTIEVLAAKTRESERKGRIMAVSDALLTAHKNLLHVIPAPLTAKEEAERVRNGEPLPDINPAELRDAARRFVEALSREPGAADELQRRGTLCETLTGEGSEYLAAKQKARKALSKWKPKEPVLPKEPALPKLGNSLEARKQRARDKKARALAKEQRILCQKSAHVLLKRLVKHFQHAGSRELVGDVRHEYEQLDQLLGWPEVPKATRALLEAWRDAAWSIVCQGGNDSLDGCYWLRHSDNLRYALFVPAAAPEIRQAADALVRWCKSHPAARTAPKIQRSTRRKAPAVEGHDSENPDVPDPDPDLVRRLRGNSRTLLVYLWKRDNVSEKQLFQAVWKGKKVTNRKKTVEDAVDYLNRRLAELGYTHTTVKRNGGLYYLKHPQK